MSRLGGGRWKRVGEWFFGEDRNGSCDLDLRRGIVLPGRHRFGTRRSAGRPRILGSLRRHVSLLIFACRHHRLSFLIFLPYALRCVMSLPVEVTLIAEDDQGVEKLKACSCDNEYVDSGGVMHVIVQKRAPGLGGDLGPPWEIFPTVDWLTSMPSLSSSPSMRGASQRGFARLILQISRRSIVSAGSPTVQYCCSPSVRRLDKNPKK